MISTIDRFVLILISRFGYAARTLISLVGASGDVLRHPRLVIEQLRFIGNDSFIIIAVSGLFVGFVLGLQDCNTLNRYGSEQALGLLVALSLVRELGPVVTALLFAGRVGTSLTAEIGLTKAGEQLTVMKMTAADPLARVLTPCFWAGFIAMPLLVAIFSAMGILGGYLVEVGLIGVDPGVLWLQIQAGVDVMDDMLSGVIKSFVFDMAVTFIALYQGYEAKVALEGVSRVTTCTVVIVSFIALALDFVLTALMFSWAVGCR